ncbi:MAG: hypothetical protein ACP5RN_06560 [Armatimonadota bacterium]
MKISMWHTSASTPPFSQREKGVRGVKGIRYRVFANGQFGLGWVYPYGQG